MEPQLSETLREGIFAGHRDAGDRCKQQQRQSARSELCRSAQYVLIW